MKIPICIKETLRISMHQEMTPIHRSSVIVNFSLFSIIALIQSIFPWCTEMNERWNFYIFNLTTYFCQIHSILDHTCRLHFLSEKRILHFTKSKITTKFFLSKTEFKNRNCEYNPMVDCNEQITLLLFFLDKIHRALYLFTFQQYDFMANLNASFPLSGKQSFAVQYKKKRNIAALYWAMISLLVCGHFCQHADIKLFDQTILHRINNLISNKHHIMRVSICLLSHFFVRPLTCKIPEIQTQIIA